MGYITLKRADLANTTVFIPTSLSTAEPVFWVRPASHYHPASRVRGLGPRRDESLNPGPSADQWPQPDSHLRTARTGVAREG